MAEPSGAELKTLLVAAYCHEPWDSERSLPKRILLTAPNSDNPESSAWDALAPALGSKTRNEFWVQHQSSDIEGNIFVGTEDVETESYVFREQDDQIEDEREIEVLFSAFIIQDFEEYWSVSLDHEDDIPLLQKHLIKQNSSIVIIADKSVADPQLERLEEENEGLRAQFEAILKLLTGFEDAHELKEWKNLPSLPMGWELLRVLRGWLDHGQFDDNQVEFAMWMLEGRSHEVWQHLNGTNSELAEILRNALWSVLDSDFSVHRGPLSSSHLRQKKLKWQKLARELDWLNYGE